MQKESKMEQNENSDQMDTENEELHHLGDSKADTDYFTWEKKLILN